VRSGALDLGLPGEDDPRRLTVRRWLSEHPHPTARDLAAAGYVAPHWPAPWGLDADPVMQLVIDEELIRAGARRPFNPIGIGWAGPTILQAGTDEQKQRWLGPLLSGEEVWCQLFSEPEAGSDLASLTTKAERDGDEWILQGQKVWTSFAHIASYGILLARTDPDAPRHQGITYFVCPMSAPGLEVVPLTDMTGEQAFNEVYLDGVRIPGDHVVGEVHKGWDLARVTLANERVSLSGQGALWGQGPTAADLVEMVRASGGCSDPVLRQRLAAVWGEGELLGMLRLRTVSAALTGKPPGPEASVRKALADSHGQRVMVLGRDLAGPYGTLPGTGPGELLRERVPDGPSGHRHPAHGVWSFGFLYSAALTIGGGTAEVQRNIIGERILGLPKDPVAG
jgi:3-oxochol-4-en-24-oyl-CoA dehydrogenase